MGIDEDDDDAPVRWAGGSEVIRPRVSRVRVGVARPWKRDRCTSKVKYCTVRSPRPGTALLESDAVRVQLDDCDLS